MNVTTEDPGVDGLRRSSTDDSTFGTRTVITSSDWFRTATGRRIGGIALLNVFTSNTDHASFVFAGNLDNGNAKSVAEAASHEAGHTFSLRHDGTATADYYGGHGNWGPIMGTPYSRSVSHWSDGQYPGPDNDEDDVEEIGRRGGVRADDHGNDAVEPVRLLDTRRSVPFSADEVRSFSSLGTQLSPLTPRSASVNVTALDQPARGFVSTFDCVTLRDTSTLNPGPGSVSANGAIVPLVGGDRSCLMSSSGGNLIVDLTGWWVP